MKENELLKQIANEIRIDAFDEWKFDKEEKQYKGYFDEDACMEILKKVLQKYKCKWTKVYHEATEAAYNTGCGKTHIFTGQMQLEGQSLEDIGHKYCQFCGEEITTGGKVLNGAGLLQPFSGI